VLYLVLSVTETENWRQCNHYYTAYSL